MMGMLLQEMDNEDHIVGWKLKNKIKWPIRKLYARKLRKKLRHWMKALLRGKGLKFTEYNKEEKFHYCEREQEILLGEGDGEEVEQRPI